MSGNSCLSALQTAPIVMAFPPRPGGSGAGMSGSSIVGSWVRVAIMASLVQVGELVLADLKLVAVPVGGGRLLGGRLGRAEERAALLAVVGALVVDEPALGAVDGHGAPPPRPDRLLVRSSGDLAGEDVGEPVDIGHREHVLAA